MKTVCTYGGVDIQRVSDDDASEYIVRGYTYCPKSVWKENVRDIHLVKGDINQVEEVTL